MREAGRTPLILLVYVHGGHVSAAGPGVLEEQCMVQSSPPSSP